MSDAIRLREKCLWTALERHVDDDQALALAARLYAFIAGEEPEPVEEGIAPTPAVAVEETAVRVAEEIAPTSKRRSTDQVLEKVFAFVRAECEAGRNPSNADIADHMGWTATGPVGRYLTMLADEGRIIRSGGNRHRKLSIPGLTPNASSEALSDSERAARVIEDRRVEEQANEPTPEPAQNMRENIQAAPLRDTGPVLRGRWLENDTPKPLAARPKPVEITPTSDSLPTLTDGEAKLLRYMLQKDGWRAMSLALIAREFGETDALVSDWRSQLLRKDYIRRRGMSPAAYEWKPIRDESGQPLMEAAQ